MFDEHKSGEKRNLVDVTRSGEERNLIDMV